VLAYLKDMMARYKEWFIFISWGFIPY
jgi:hypothetical protein